MSLQAIEWALKQDVSPPPSVKLVLLVLAHHARPSGIAWPGQALVAQECSIKVKTVQRGEDALVEQGLIWKARRLRDGLRTSDWIILGPGGDRSPMIDPDSSEFPDEVISACAQPTGLSDKSTRHACTPSRQNTATLTDRSGGLSDKIGELTDSRGVRTNSRTSNWEQQAELPTEPATTATARERMAEVATEVDVQAAYEQLVLAVQRTEQFIDRRIECGIGKSEYREDDLDFWVGDFESLSISEEDFDLALAEAFAELRRPTGRFPDWRTRLGGRGAGRAFVAESSRLLAALRDREELFAVK